MSTAQQAALAAINRRYKRPLVTRGAEIHISDMLPFGLPSLDLELGGGLGTGRLSLIVGQEGTAKTTLCAALSAQALRCGMDVYYVDIERAVDPCWLAKGGLDVNHENFLVVTGHDERGLVGEDVYRVVRELLKAVERPSLLVIDSLAAMLPEEDTQDTTTIAPGAKLVNRAIRVWNLLVPSHSILVMINQYRSGPQATAGTLPHGMAQLFHASQRLDLKRGSWLLEADQPVGVEVRFRVQKNKLARPFGSGVLDLYFERPVIFDVDKSLVLAAVRTGVVEQSGAWFSHGGLKVQGQQKLMEALQSDSVLRAAVWKETYRRMSSRKIYSVGGEG